MSNENTKTTTTPITQAHESRFNNAYLSEALTAFSSGYKDTEDLAGLLEFIAPAVPVARRFEFRKVDNAQAFLSETDDVRAIGANFKCVEYSGYIVNEKTLNKGLTMRIDHDDTFGDDWQERYTQLLIQRLYRNELRRTVAMLESIAVTKALKWGKSASPDSDLRRALVDAADKSGVRPNRVLFGDSAWDLRAFAYESKDTSAASRASDLSQTDLASKLLVDEVRVLRARYQTQPNEKSKIVGSDVYAFFAQSIPAKDEPSNLKRFMTPADGGSPFRVFVEEHAKFTDLTVEHYSNIVVTSDVGIQRISVSE